VGTGLHIQALKQGIAPCQNDITSFEDKLQHCVTMHTFAVKSFDAATRRFMSFDS